MSKASAPKASGLKVLFLPKNSRLTFFQSFLESARDTQGWHLRIVAPRSERGTWQQLVRDDDAFQAIPNFLHPQSWEDDQETVEAIDRRINDCEIETGVSAGRILLAGERDLGRGFSQPVYYWVENQMARKTLSDNTEPFKILRRMFAFVFDYMDANKPDLVLSGEWADPLWFTFQLVARSMGIPCIVNRYSKLWSGRCFWSAEPLMYNDSRSEAQRTKTAGRNDISQRSREHIESFREKPEMVSYVRANWDRLDRGTWYRRHALIARRMYAGWRDRFMGNPSISRPAHQMLIDHYRRPYLKWRNAGFFSKLEATELESLPYIYLALHKDPEQTLNYQAPYWSYQMYTVGLLSSCLPNGFRLLVREHRANVDRRKPRFYKHMAALPGVTLIDAFDDQYKYIQNADLIVTENGSSGWEGLMLGRRVITLSDTYYDGSGLEKRVFEPEELATEVMERLAKPPVTDQDRHDAALGKLLDAEWMTTAPVDEPGHRDALSLLQSLLSDTIHQKPRESSQAT